MDLGAIEDCVGECLMARFHGVEARDDTLEHCSIGTARLRHVSQLVPYLGHQLHHFSHRRHRFCMDLFVPSLTVREVVGQIPEHPLDVLHDLVGAVRLGFSHA